jgi:hypothetical protein
MAKKFASKEVREKIRRLASNPEKVILSGKAAYGLMCTSLAKLGVCDEICEWIDKNQAIREQETTEPPEHAEKPVYVIKPKIDGVIYYIRLGIDEANILSERLIIISVHPDT